MWLYRVLFGFDLLVVLVLAYFFVDDLQYDRSGGAPAYWLPVIGIPIAVMAASVAAHAHGRKRLATWLLVLLTLPPLLFVLFFGFLFATVGRWN
jgi:hypothetical protein